MTKPAEDNAAGGTEQSPDRSGRSSSRLRRVQSSGKRGRRPSRVDRSAKLERSRQSARECRARKKQKYQLLEETVTDKEKQILGLREKLEKYKNICEKMDNGERSEEIKKILQNDAAAETAEVEEEEVALPSVSREPSTPQPSLDGGDSSSDDEFD